MGTVNQNKLWSRNKRRDEDRRHDKQVSEERWQAFKARECERFLKSEKARALRKKGVIK